MKQNFILILMLLIVATATDLLAQAPQSFKYQSIARDGADVLISDANIHLEISIHDLTPSGTVVYKERHNVTTNSLGLFTISVGAGEATDNFALIDWRGGAKFIEVAADFTGGTNFSSLGTTQLLSVPYALWAENSGSADKLSDDEWTDLLTPLGWTKTTPCKCRKINGWIEFRGKFEFPALVPSGNKFYLLPPKCSPTQQREFHALGDDTFDHPQTMRLVVYPDGQISFTHTQGSSHGLFLEGVRIWGEVD
jgi:hypothetical protein